ncbi:MAG: ABC transporter permease [Caldicoprobacterales bacterium]
MKSETRIDGKTIQLTIISIVLFLIMMVLRPDNFLRSANIDSMLFQLAEPGLFAMCIAIAYLSRGIDLSIVSIANLVGIVNGIILRNMVNEGGSNELPVLLFCVLVALIIGVMCGLLNGFLIAKVGIFPILATLGTQNVYMGIAMALTQGRAEGNFPQILLDFGNAHFIGVPVITWIFLMLFGVICVIVHKTPYGRKLQWMGSNIKTAWYTGIDNEKVTFITYTISGLLASIAGLIIMSRTNSAKADYGLTYVFQALLTCVLAGVSPLGGRGKVYNVLLSLIALQILSTGFNMLRISPLIRDSIFGFLLVISILLDYIVEKRRIDKLNKAAIKMV